VTKRAISYRLEARGGLGTCCCQYLSGSQLLETKRTSGDMEKEMQNDCGVVIEFRSHRTSASITYIQSFDFPEIFLPPVGVLSVFGTSLFIFYQVCVSAVYRDCACMYTERPNRAGRATLAASCLVQYLGQPASSSSPFLALSRSLSPCSSVLPVSCLVLPTRSGANHRRTP
jgi:hypothetical protein